MAVGLALNVAQVLFAALQCTELRELSFTFLEYKSRLEDLQRTVNTIKTVLLDAESKHQQLNNEGRDWIEKLKDVVYDADDLFDEIITKAQKKRMSKRKISKKVRRFLSVDNELFFGFNKSREIKKLREKLDGIANDHWKFGFSEQYRPVKRREETCSYVFETNIIGREAEKEYIVKMLLSDLTSSVSFVSIVGMGGLGKTTLAQLVFNDKRIKDAFGKDLYWVCVSEEFGLKQILCKLHDNRNDCTLEHLQKEVLRMLEGKRFLLVLDDVWEESPHKWINLKEYLRSGGEGSRVLITTRSREVAQAVDKDFIFDLKGLTEENSWQLFKKIAFGQGDDHDTHIVEMGKDILKKCANVPLSIKVISSLLHGRDESKWEAFRKTDLANMSCYGEKDPIMSTLMFSYYNLTLELKSCFSFCSLFPKDYEIEKELLISLWLAQGYLVPSREGESMEDVGADYFWILLQRCFFQGVKQDEYGEIHSCKMHDLMHDLAQEVAGKESLLLTTSDNTNSLKQKLRHLSTTCDAPIDALCNKYCLSRKTLRTLLKLNMFSSMDAARVVLNCRCLRVLHLRCRNMNLLPDEVGKLLHLRYLGVSYSSSLKMLPRSITKLHNLQILMLRGCDKLKKLPKDIGKLVNLRILDMYGCSLLEKLPKDIGKLVNLRTLNINAYRETCNVSYMPIGMDKLRNLNTLTHFIVGGNASTQFQRGELIDLKGLISLKGHLCIKVGRFSPRNMPISTKGADILKNMHLKSLKIVCFEGQLDQGEYQETLLEGLYPNNDHLRELVMSGYQGIKFPNWGVGKVCFCVGIVRMELTNCVGLNHLSSLSKLVCIKYIRLEGMKNLEYIERDAPHPCDVSETLFLSLEELFLKDAEKLKGWWRDIVIRKNEARGSGSLMDIDGNWIEVLPSFTRLRDLKIIGCNSLKFFPPCPRLKKLDLEGVDGALTFCMKRSTYFDPSLVTGITPSTSTPSTSSVSGFCFDHPTLFCLDKLDIEDSNVFNSLFRESFLGCANIYLSSVKEMKEISEGLEMCPSSVRHLSIHFQSMAGEVSGGELEYFTNQQFLKIVCCLGEDDKEGMPWKSFSSLSSLVLYKLPKLVNVPNGLHYLTSLQSLVIEECHNLEVEGMPWESFGSLSSLELIELPKLVNLPRDFQYLSTIQYLRIQRCDNLEVLGEVVGFLTSLQSLHINWCPKLQSLPHCMCHLTSLTQLQLYVVSEELKEQCREPDGDEWPKISHIPDLYIHW